MHPTAERLLQATEELLHEKGQAQISLRDITERADANVASVSYHFRSKDALIAEVFGRALDEVTDLRRRELQALPPDAGLREVVRAWLAPALEPAAQEPRESQLWALIARGMREQAPGLLQHVAHVRGAADDELVELLAPRLPHLGPEELRVRCAATLAALSSLDLSPGGEAMPGPGSQPVELVLDWVVAGLTGPGRTSGGDGVGR